MSIDSETLARVLALPPDQRVQLAQQLLDSVAEAPADVAVPAWQTEEVCRRADQAAAHPEALMSEDQFWRAVDAE